MLYWIINWSRGEYKKIIFCRSKITKSITMVYLYSTKNHNVYNEGALTSSAWSPGTVFISANIWDENNKHIQEGLELNNHKHCWVVFFWSIQAQSVHIKPDNRYIVGDNLIISWQTLHIMFCCGRRLEKGNLIYRHSTV